MHLADADLLLTAQHDQAAQALLDALGLVPHAAIRIKHTGINPEIIDLSDERIGGGLPNVSC